jgi:tol-pal system protein YbgF
MKRAALFLVLFAAGSPWCAAGLFSDDEAHRKIVDLQQQIQALDGRVAGVESTVRSQGLVELLSQVDALKTEIGKLRGQLEVQAHDIETTQKRSRDLYVDLDARLRRLEGGSAATPTGPSAGDQGAATPSPQASGSVPAASADEGKSYEAALSMFKVGNYQGAIAGFQNFLGAHANSPLAPSAQYWIGNSYFNLRDYKNAIASQQKLVSQHPSSQKVPDAMLNIASSQQGLGEMTAARKTLQELVAKYPLSNAADLAKKRLAGSK